jgi:hypothetical protein
MNFFLGNKLYSGIKLLIDKKMKIDINKYNIIIDKKQIGWPFTESTESRSTIKKETKFTKTKRKRPEKIKKTEKAEKVEKVEKIEKVEKVLKEKNYKKANLEPEPEIFMNFRKFNPKKISKGKNPNIQVSQGSNLLIIKKKILEGTSLEKLFKKNGLQNSKNIPQNPKSSQNPKFPQNYPNHQYTQNLHKASHMNKNYKTNIPYNILHSGYMPKPLDPSAALKDPKINIFLHQLFNNNSKNSKHIKMENFDRIFSEQFSSLKINNETHKKLEPEKVELIDLEDEKPQEFNPELDMIGQNNMANLLNSTFHANFQGKNPLQLFFKEESDITMIIKLWMFRLI